jgi:hypothetical protein
VLKPGLALVLWLAFAVLMVVNNMLGDTVIAISIGPRLAAWYKAMVPVPYVALLAVIHARRTSGSQWLAAAAVPAVAWPLSTALLDAAYGRITFHEDWAAIADRYGVQWGAPFPWLLLSQVVLPPLVGWIVARMGGQARKR